MVVICFQISIFEPLNTATHINCIGHFTLWFAFKLVSLNHWIQLYARITLLDTVVICFQISIFEPLNTADIICTFVGAWLWFAFKLVSLNHWIQPVYFYCSSNPVVICFQISIFEPLNTAQVLNLQEEIVLWFAFKLVSLNHWIQQITITTRPNSRCDLLSN